MQMKKELKNKIKKFLTKQKASANPAFIGAFTEIFI